MCGLLTFQYFWIANVFPVAFLVRVARLRECRPKEIGDLAMAPKFSAALGLIAFACVLLSTLFGVTPFADWLLNAAEALFIVAIIIFGGYIVLGVIGDAGTV